MEVLVIIAAEYSFNEGKEKIENEAFDLKSEILEVIRAVDASLCRTKVSKEKTKNGHILYSPACLNKLFSKEFETRGWRKKKIECKYSNSYYTKEFIEKCPEEIRKIENAFREMDFVKRSSSERSIGIEVQFGKYAFMVYNVAAKMTIFHNSGIIDFGVEIVPVKALTKEMSTGVSYFEQFVWDLEKRGIANIDIPVWIIGVYP
jgi:hypothetical protein